MMWRIKRLLGNKTLLVLALSYSGVVTVLFLLPSSDLPKVALPVGADKLVHLLIYVLMVCLWQLYLFQKNGGALTKTDLWAIFLGSLLYGIIIEILQGLLTDSRSPDIWDVVANLIGTLIGIFTFKKMKRIFMP